MLTDQDSPAIRTTVRGDSQSLVLHVTRNLTFHSRFKLVVHRMFPRSKMNKIAKFDSLA